MSSFPTGRIEALRHIMRAESIDAVIFPQTDPHQSEYIADHWQVRRFLSGFTGSAGSLVVTETDAFIWTDSRYFIQASEQLEGSGIGLMKEGLPGTPSIEEWLAENLPAGSTVGVNGMVYSLTAATSLRDTLQRNGIGLNTDFDPVDALWTDRPQLPDDPVFVHDEKFAGEPASSKISRVMDGVVANGCEAIFISALDEIAWVLNIRSSDVPCNPVATSFLYLSADCKVLFINEDKIDETVRRHLADCDIDIEPYDAVARYLALLPANGRVLTEPSRTACTLASVLGSRAVSGHSPVAMLKAIKNRTQLEGTRAAMIRDGAALVDTVMEIERKLASGEKVTEIDVDAIATKFRAAQELYFDNSFETIAGYGPHGAIVHYTATPESDAVLEPHGLLLIDSGAQYLDGTTDITRTIALGTPTSEEKRDFTLVIKGHIALGSAVFPAGTRGDQLDVLARQFLWREGLSYLHGTGHGVGHFLNVHEGPQSIRLNHNDTPLVPGMITSNEPGLYRERIHGIRCENLVLTVPAMSSPEYGEFLRFETLTLFPFDRKLFDLGIMTDEEIAWVNNYHADVRSKLTPALSGDAARNWLYSATEPLER